MSHQEGSEERDGAIDAEGGAYAGVSDSSSYDRSSSQVSNSNNGLVLLQDHREGEDEEANHCYVSMEKSEWTNVEMVPMGGITRGRRRGNPYDEDCNDLEGESGRPSNEKLLSTAFFSFMGFTVVQTVAAFIADSEAMMGDSAAMFVDALTYLFNLVAERRKSRFDELWKGTNETDPGRVRRIKRRAQRKMTLHLELVPPLVSVATLLIVTAVVSHKAISVLILDVHRSKSQQGRPNVNLMLFFSVLNLFLDGLNVFCFAKAKRLLGYETTMDHITHEQPASSASSRQTKDSPRQTARRPRNYEYLDPSDLELDEHVVLASAEDVDDLSLREQMDLVKEADVGTPGNGNGSHVDTQLSEQNGHHEIAVSDNQDLSRLPSNGHSSTNITQLDLSDHSGNSENQPPNLNMCSAYTHVFADTLRSIAVVIASIIAEVVDGVTPEEADATAAVIVSVLILLSLIPLFQGLVHTFSELKAIRAEEESERMFPKEAIRVATVT